MKADGSWLYILLSIVFLVLSAIGNKNKKKYTTSTPPLNEEDDFEPIPSQPQRPVAETSRDWPRSLEDVLKEVLDVPGSREVVTEKPQTWSRDTILENTQNSYEKIEEEAKSLEVIESDVFTYDSPEEITKPVTFTYSEPVQVDRNEEREPVLSLENLDLRQGIIYAEILNRKYF